MKYEKHRSAVCFICCRNAGKAPKGIIMNLKKDDEKTTSNKHSFIHDE